MYRYERPYRPQAAPLSKCRRRSCSRYVAWRRTRTGSTPTVTQPLGRPLDEELRQVFRQQRNQTPFSVNLDEFYREVRRVLKPNGILAAWTYSFTEISPEIDVLVRQYYYEIVGEFWPERIHYLEEEYKTLPFPFEEIVAPVFVMKAKWSLDQYAGFLNSWSATQRYKEQSGHHPLEKIWDQLSAAWGSGSRLVRWPLHFRIGRKVSQS